jgi:DNA-binding transcriptional LysR family regulator
MRPGALADLNTFLLVAEHLSFRAAAERLELTAPAVSHAIRHLEGRLGVRLLNRTTRSVSLTHAGIRLVDRQRPAFDQISGAIEELNGERRRPVGRLRIWASPMATTIVVTTIWQRYLSTYPDVHLEVWIDVGRVDVVASGFDAGIGLKDWAPSDMIGVRLTGPRSLSSVPRGILSVAGLRARPLTSPGTAVFNIEWEQRAHFLNGLLSGMERRARLPSQAD